MSRKVDSAEAKTIGFQIRSARESRGLTIEQFSQVCGLHYTQVSKIERGLFKRLTQHVLKMCKSADVTLDAPNDASPSQLHSRLDELIRGRPEMAFVIRAIFDAFDRIL